MDDIAQYNINRWQALADADALFTRAKLTLDVTSAQALVDADGTFGDLCGKRVLCLAGGGGQQSAAYALLGAQVTVVDLSEAQLERDLQAAAHYGVTIHVLAADMRDLNQLSPDSFDLVDQPYSLNFVPDARAVFEQVACVLKPGGLYRFMCANPFAAGITERDWNGDGYPLKRAYVQGERYAYDDQDWVYDRDAHGKIPPPQEFRHTLSALLNGLIENGFVLQQFTEVGSYEAHINAEPGTWDHFSAVLPPWIVLLARYQP